MLRDYFSCNLFFTIWSSHCHPRFYELKSNRSDSTRYHTIGTFTASSSRARIWNQVYLWSLSHGICENCLPVSFLALSATITSGLKPDCSLWEPLLPPTHSTRSVSQMTPLFPSHDSAPSCPQVSLSPVCPFYTAAKTCQKYKATSC